VWRWFPEGRFWLEAVKMHGENVIERLTAAFYYTLDGDVKRRTAFANHSNESSVMVEGINFDSVFRNESIENSTMAVFYHIRADSNRVVVREQLRAARLAAATHLSQTPVQLFYSVVGNNSTVAVRRRKRKRSIRLKNLSPSEVHQMCERDAPKNFRCSALPHFEVPFEGETLRNLHQYCHSNPFSTAAYIQSELPDYLGALVENGTQRFNLLLHLSRASLGRACMKAIRPTTIDGPICNTCGLIFYKLWTLFYPGNMFIASCQYINKLLPPSIFESKMAEYTKIALLARLRWNLVSGLFYSGTHSPLDTLNERLTVHGRDVVEMWGLDRFSVDFWVASHPAVNPCDVSHLMTRDFSYWSTTEAELLTKQPQLRYTPALPAPNRPDSPFHFSSEAFENVMSNVSSRVREISFLGGHLLRWYTLYDRAPAFDSPIWSWFPDSKVWKEGVANYGNRVTFETTEPFVHFST
jgi:hypothetical protein